MTHATSAFRWEEAAYSESSARNLAQTLEVPLPLARVLAGRGYTDPAEAERFLAPSLDDLTHPYEMPGLETSVNRIMGAISSDERISIYGDYDCDGLTGSLILARVLRHLGGQVEIFIPKRLEDGYGFTIGALERVIAEQKPDLIITSDCGMRSGEAVEDARRDGIDVVITDHHAGYVDELPHAVAVVNPKLPGTAAALEGLSGCGVAYTLCRGLLLAAREKGWQEADTIDLSSFLDLVAMGTITDLMPLTGENRILVRHGLDLLNDEKRRRPGLVALTRVAGIRTSLGSYEVGFQLGPRINAAGRMGSAELSLNLLGETDAWQARRLAGQVDACNRERKRMECVVMNEALEQVASQVQIDACGLVAGQQGWHVGAIGIVAARLCGRYNRPAVVVSFGDDGYGRGSCRSTSQVNMVDVLSRCAKHLVQYGGHKAAAGFCLRKEEFEGFVETFAQACGACMLKEDLLESCLVDSPIDLAEADEALMASIQSLQPLGVGNQTPVWFASGVQVMGSPSIVGGNHLKMVLASGTTQRDAIGFGMADRKQVQGCLDVLFQLQYNHFRGKRSLQLSLKDFRPSQA